MVYLLKMVGLSVAMLNNQMVIGDSPLLTMYESRMNQLQAGEEAEHLAEAELGPAWSRPRHEIHKEIWV